MVNCYGPFLIYFVYTNLPVQLWLCLGVGRYFYTFHSLFCIQICWYRCECVWVQDFFFFYTPFPVLRTELSVEVWTCLGAKRYFYALHSLFCYLYTELSVQVWMCLGAERYFYTLHSLSCIQNCQYRCECVWVQEDAFIHFIPCTAYIIVSTGVHVSWSQDRCTCSCDVRTIPLTGNIITCKTSLSFRVFTNLGSLSAVSVIMDRWNNIHVYLFTPPPTPTPPPH